MLSGANITIHTIVQYNLAYRTQADQGVMQQPKFFGTIRSSL
jgi:hypothetical protein